MTNNVTPSFNSWGWNQVTNPISSALGSAGRFIGNTAMNEFLGVDDFRRAFDPNRSFLDRLKSGATGVAELGSTAALFTPAAPVAGLSKLGKAARFTTAYRGTPFEKIMQAGFKGLFGTEDKTAPTTAPFTTPMTISGQVPVQTPATTPPGLTPADISSVGKGAYNAAVGQANSLFNVQKKEARNQLTQLMQGIGQQVSGGSADMAMQAAQMGLDTSPGALDVGQEYLAGAGAAQELKARKAFTDTLQNLELQRAKQMQAAAASRQAAQSEALIADFLANQQFMEAADRQRAFQNILATLGRA